MSIAAYEQLVSSSPNIKYIKLANSKEPADVCFDLLIHRYVVVISNHRYLCRSAVEAEYIRTLYNAGYRKVAIPEDERIIELVLDKIKRETNETKEDQSLNTKTVNYLHH